MLNVKTKYGRLVQRAVSAAAVLTAVSAAIPMTGYIASADTAVSSSASSASGSSTEQGSSDMKKALAIVKNRYAIPEEYTAFDYSASESNTRKIFQFTWKTDDGKKAIKATVKGGVITSFTVSSNQHTSTPGFCPMTDAEYKAKAMNYVYQLNPELKGMLTFTSMRYTASSDSVYLYFDQSYKDVKITQRNFFVTLNKYTGELVSYSGDYWENAEYIEPGKALSQDKIKEIYRQDTTLKPYYRISYDQNNNQIVNIVYQPSPSEIYDAVTGELSSMSEDYRSYMDTSNAAYAAGAADTTAESVEEDAADEGGFTDAEISAVKELSGLLSTDELTKLLYKDKYLGLTSDYMLQSSNYYKNEYTDGRTEYLCTLNYVINTSKKYSYISVNCNAETGRIISFWSRKPGATSKLDVSAANKLANEAAKYYMGDKFSEYTASTDNTKPSASTGDYTETQRYMSYLRYVNNIQVSGDNVSISVNSEGEVISFNYTYTEADFGDGKVISEETVFKKLFEQKDMDLLFRGFSDLESNPHIYLTYYMSDWYMNAKTGKLCNYSGTTLSESDDKSSACPYTDIADSAYKAEIETLYRHSIKLSNDDKLKPSNAVTYSEMSSLINNIMNVETYYDYYNEVGVYKNFVENTEESEKKYITRAEMAEMFVKAMGLSQAAELDGIYKAPYADIPENHEKAGYIAIAKALSFIPNTEKLNPDSLVSREYALHCVYQYIAGQR